MTIYQTAAFRALHPHEFEPDEDTPERCALCGLEFGAECHVEEPLFDEPDDEEQTFADPQTFGALMGLAGLR